MSLTRPQLMENSPPMAFTVAETAEVLSVTEADVLKAMEHKADNLPHLRVVYFNGQLIIPVFAIEDYLRRKLTRFRG